MPQMKPLIWIFILAASLLSMAIVLANIYFNLHLYMTLEKMKSKSSISLPKNTSNKPSQKSSSKTWKWFW